MKIVVPKRTIEIVEWSSFSEPGLSLDRHREELKLAIAQGMQRYALGAEYHDEDGEAFFPTVAVTNPRRLWT